ncbi:hypothetical protein V490_04071 [Pseudogymnoascus sp. VKM F-3557]|nr:hypothetical protein V490_04071 [Pseudogymnoascus sp. VKM F-3557]
MKTAPQTTQPHITTTIPPTTRNTKRNPMPPSSKAQSSTSFHTARTTMSPTPRSPLKRLHAELSALQSLSSRTASEKESSAIERLEPVDSDDLFKWEAVVRGAGLGGGYDEGRWLLEIQVPETYPNAPPKVRFRTRVVGSNVDFEVCICCVSLLAPPVPAWGGGPEKSASTS